MATDPTAAYRKQQGIAPITQSYDPKVVGWVVQAAKETGADPTALLATAIQESGARTGAIGDGGTSYGPWQFHRGGALGTHTPQWANSYEAALNRAQEFAKDQVHHGKGAAAVQRPADQTLYAQGVDSHMQQAKAILAHFGLKMPAAPATPAMPTATPSASTPSVIPGGSLLASLLADQSEGYVSPLQGISNSIAKLAHITPISLPNQPLAAPTTTATLPTATRPTPTQQASKTMRPTGRVVTVKNPKLIGLPYQGTHKLYGNWESDNAIDIALPRMTPVYATANGVIGSQIGSLNSSDPHMAGERLHLKVAGNELYYQHLSKIVVQAGQRVQRGQLLGYTGALNHLHLGVQKGDPRRYA